MIGYVFIQTDETTPKGQKFIHSFEMVFGIGAKFSHPNFEIKEGTI